MFEVRLQSVLVTPREVAISVKCAARPHVSWDSCRDGASALAQARTSAVPCPQQLTLASARWPPGPSAPPHPQSPVSLTPATPSGHLVIGPPPHLELVPGHLAPPLAVADREPRHSVPRWWQHLQGFPSLGVSVKGEFSGSQTECVLFYALTILGKES